MFADPDRPDWERDRDEHTDPRDRLRMGRFGLLGPLLRGRLLYRSMMSRDAVM